MKFEVFTSLDGYEGNWYQPSGFNQESNLEDFLKVVERLVEEEAFVKIYIDDKPVIKTLVPNALLKRGLATPYTYEDVKNAITKYIENT